MSNNQNQNTLGDTNNLLKMQAEANQNDRIIEYQNSRLSYRQKQVEGQRNEIEDKMKLLETRNQMLELAIERNIYKKKVIYALISLLILFLIGVLVVVKILSNK